jgi:hypothetical protein
MHGRPSRILRKLLVGLGLLGLAALVIGGTLVIKHARDMHWFVEAIAARCGASRDVSGFGAVMITEDLKLDGVSDSIATPCRLYLRNGVHLTLRHMHLRSSSLFISDGPVLHPTGSGGSYADPWPAQTATSTAVILDGTWLVGGAGSQFVVFLMEKSDRFSVVDSTVEYPILVQASVGNDAVVWPDRAQGGGVIDLRDSTIRAMDSKGYGIQIGASQQGGIATFTNVRFDTGSRMYVPAFLHAGTCRAERTPGIGPSCSMAAGPSTLHVARLTPSE